MRKLKCLACSEDVVGKFFLRGIEYLSYLLILLYVVGKSFELITVLIDVLFIFILLKNRDEAIKILLRYKKIIVSFGLLMVYFIIQSSLSNDFSYSLRHSFGMIRFIFLFFAVMYVFNSREKIKKMIIVVFVALFIVNSDALYQYVFGVDMIGQPMWGSRLTIWTDRPIVNLYSGEFFGFILASIFLLEGYYRKIAIASVIFFLIIFFLSGNRSPIVALFSTVFFVGMFSEYKKYFIYLFLFLSFLFGLTFLNPHLAKGYSGIFNPTSNTAISGRSQVYKISIEIIKDNPLIGIGGGMYRYEFQNYYTKIYDATSKDGYEKRWLQISPHHSHNILLDVLVSWGCIGLCLFIYIGYTIFKTFIKDKPLSLLASMGLIYCVTPLQFAKSLSQSDWQFYTFLGLIFLGLVSTYESLATNYKD